MSAFASGPSVAAVLNWSTNTAIGDSGHSPRQWVLGRSLLFSSGLVRHSQHLTNEIVMILLISVVLPCWPKHRDPSSAPSTTRALSRAFLSRTRSANNSPSQVRFVVGDQVMCWRGNKKRKSQWSMRWLGPCHWA